MIYGSPIVIDFERLVCSTEDTLKNRFSGHFSRGALKLFVKLLDSFPMVAVKA